MNGCPSMLLVVGIALQLAVPADAAADITLNSVAISNGYAVSTVPTSIIISTTHTTADSTGPIVYTFDTAIFGATKTPSCTASLSTGTATFTCATSANGQILTATLASGSVAAGATLGLTVATAAAGDFVALPGTAADVQMSTLTANGGGDTLNGGAAVVFRVVPAATITLTSADMNAGTTPTSLRVQFTTPKAVASTQTCCIHASQSIFTASVTTGLTDPGSIFSSYVTTSTKFTGTLGGNIAINTAIDFTLPTAMMAQLPAVAGAVTIDIELNDLTSINDATGFGTIISSGGVSGDPVSWFGNLRTEFLLPMGQHSMLLQTPDMVVIAWPFQGKGEDQWIGKVVVASRTGDTVVEVDVKENLRGFDRTKLDPGAFETLDVIIGPSSSASRLVHIPGHDEQVDHPENLVLKFGRITAWSPTGPICMQHRFFPCRENVMVFSKYAKVVIQSSSAVEYYGMSEDAVDHAHLDVQVMDMVQSDSFSGILPEIWGLKPISAATQAMVKSQSRCNADLGNTTAKVMSNTSEDVTSASWISSSLAEGVITV